MYNNYNNSAIPSVTTTEAKIFPILATIGVPIEMMGMITCEMAGFCHIYDDDDDQNDEVEYDQSDDEEQPGESIARWKRRYLRAATQCRHAAGTIQISETPGQLVCFFPRAYLRTCTRAKFFDRRFFSIPQPCPLPDSLCQKLQIPLGTHILPRQCAIVKKNGGYEIVVRADSTF
jgi:hypothetical protein